MTEDEMFTDLTAEIEELASSPALGPAIAARREQMRNADRAYAMGLATVRNAFEMTQTELANKLGVSQVAVSRMEKRPDMLISTLRSYLKAMHGTVRLVVSFPDREDLEVTLEAVERAASHHSDV